MKIKNSELLAILEDVENDLAKAFATSKGDLAKAEEHELVESGRKAAEHKGYHDSPEHHDQVVEPEVHKASPSPSASESSTSASKTARKAEHSASESSSSSSLSKDSPDLEGSSPSAPSASASSPSASEGSSPKSADDLHSELSAEAQPQKDPIANGQPGQPGQPQTYSLEELTTEYQQLPPEELDIHLQAAMAAKEAQSGGMDQQQPPLDQGAPPPSPAPSPSPEMAMKNEDKLAPVAPTKAGSGTDKLGAVKPTDARSAGPSRLDATAPSKEHMGAAKSEAPAEVPLAKSESDQVRDEEIKSLKEDVQILTKALEHVLETPMRKAITTIAHIPRTEGDAPVVSTEKKPLTMEVVRAKLTALTATKLEKSDRELINAWYERKVGLDQLAKFFE